MFHDIEKALFEIATLNATYLSVNHVLVGAIAIKNVLLNTEIRVVFFLLSDILHIVKTSIWKVDIVKYMVCDQI